MSELLKGVRKKLISAYESLVVLITPNLENASDLVDNKEKIKESLDRFKGELVNFKEVVNGNKELRNGNVLNALNEAEILVSDNKCLEHFKKLLEKVEENEEVLNELQVEFGGIRSKQNTLLKFLESEVNAESEKEQAL